MEVAEESNKKGMRRHDDEDIDVHHSLKRKRRRRFMKNICLGLIAVILVVVLILLILALTVFKAKRPVPTVNSLSLDHLDFDLDIPRLQVHLNITLRVHLSIKNPNKVGFSYTNSSALLKYKADQVIGQVPIPAGKIKSDGTTPMNLTLTVMADRLLSDSNVYSDVISGTLPLTTYTRIKGKVRILKLFTIHLVSYSTCDLTINVRGGGSLANQNCRYKTKL